MLAQKPPVRRRLRPSALMVAVSAIVTATLLASCSSAPSSSGSGGGASVKLTMMVEAVTTGSPYGQMAKKYTEQHPNVTIRANEVPNETLPQVLGTQLRGGNGPDLFFVTGGSGNADSAIPLAKAGYLKSLSGTPAEKLLNDSTRDLYDYQGKVWAQPLDNLAYTTNWNTNAAKAAGITPPTTVAQVYAACAQAAKAGIKLYTLAGSAVQNTGLMTMEIAASTVYSKTPDWDQQRADGKVTFAGSAGWKAALQTIVDLQRAGCFPPDAAAGAVANNTPNVVAGKTLASFSPTGALSDMHRLNKANTYAAYAFPGATAADTGLMVSPSNALAVNAKSSTEKQAAALDFLAWLAQPKNADETASLSGNLSITAGESAALPATFKALQPYLAGAASKNGLLRSLLWPNQNVYNDLGVGVQGLLTGQTTIDAILNKMDADWD